MGHLVEVGSRKCIEPGDATMSKYYTGGLQLAR
jgi:hypothetical protein